jgi:DNA (cytosine-5)-methyltransferase 1
MSALIPSKTFLGWPDGALFGDLFAGGGGVSVGATKALGRAPDFAINHWDLAMKVHARNHPETEHYTANLWEARPRDIARGRPVAGLWFSPDCTHFSVARGGKPALHEIRALAEIVPEWLRDLRPAVWFLENVREFQDWGPLDAEGHVIPSRKGEFFKPWLHEIQRLGYRVEWKVLDCSKYGAPTKRKRLFMIGRCDGAPIVWPEETHGPGLLPFHTAAECIDWSVPAHSIFMSREEARVLGIKRPLAEKTMWRIAQGLWHFLFNCPAPFLLKVNHGGVGRSEARIERLDEPMSTVTASRRGLALVAPVLQQSGYGERDGQRARVLNINEPIGTIVDGQKHALVMAFLTKYFGEREGGFAGGSSLGAPIGAVTARDHHGLISGNLIKLRGQCHGAHLREPMPSLTAKGTHVAEVRAYLTAFYGDDHAKGMGQDLREPMRTLTSRARLGLVEVHGELHQLTDICFRMLTVPELLRGQMGEYAEGFDLSDAETQEDQIALVGNMVPPKMVERLIASNPPRALRRAA